jgi:hypothetical protein
MSNVVYFPGYLFIDGAYWHHGKKFKTLRAMVEAISQEDYQRSLAWDRQRLGVTDHARSSPQAKVWSKNCQ